MARAAKNSRADDDTIVAIITPPGEGGIAAIRLAGPAARTIASHFFSAPTGESANWIPFLLRLGYFANSAGERLDEIMAVYMPEGRSYTGREQVELFCHGGRLVVRRILDQLIAAGARPAEPGEFTRLSFLSGRIDLARAEAVAEMIAANTDSALHASREHLLGAYSEHVTQLREQLAKVRAEVEASIDFPEEEISPAGRTELIATVTQVEQELHTLIDSYRGGRIINEGFKVAIGGRPNAGKSSLFNLLLRQERALVNPTPGTTRDYISESIDIEGFKVHIIDTAGLRGKGGTVERQGQERAKEIIKDSHLLLWLVDLSQKSWERTLHTDLASLPKGERLIVGNKCDLLPAGSSASFPAPIDVHISCHTRAGLPQLHTELLARINAKMPDLTSGLVVTSARHKQKLSSALKSARAARLKISEGESPELTAIDLRDAANCLDEITGKLYTEQILERIFAKFCIGK
jgi:tRNA modification GTPase